MRFAIRSVGLSPKSERQLKDKDLVWANLVLVMERGQGARIKESYWHLAVPPIDVLHIADEYEYLESELVELLTERINKSLNVAFQI